MSNQLWSWILTAVGLTGFILAGKKVWWCWYVNIGCQALWLSYALITRQYGFVVAAVAYTIVFTRNAIKWRREHKELVGLVHNFKFDTGFNRLPEWTNFPKELRLLKDGACPGELLKKQIEEANLHPKLMVYEQGSTLEFSALPVTQIHYSNEQNIKGLEVREVIVDETADYHNRMSQSEDNNGEGAED